MAKKQKRKSDKLNIVIIVLIISLLPLGLLFFDPVQETALPNDLQLTREESFPKIETISEDEFSDSIKLDDKIDLSKIYKIEFFLTACSTKAEFILNNEKIGETTFPNCEDRFFSEDSGSPFIHYEEKKVEKFFRFQDFPSKNIDFEIKTTKTEGRTFTTNGQTITAEEPFNPEVRIIRAVSCTRSSQCIPTTIILGGKETEVQPICSYISNKCSIDLDELSVEDVGDLNSDEENKISFGIPKTTLIGSIAVIITIILILIGVKKFKK